MSASYRVIAAHELDAGLLAAWRSIQEREPRLAGPYFCPEFTQAVARVRGDVRLAVIQNGGVPAGFFPHQRAPWGRGSPVGGALSDYHGVIATPGADWRVAELMRAARLATWSFDHLVDVSGRFAPHVTARVSSPQIDLERGLGQYQDAARKARKLAREAGELTFELHAPAALGSLFDWKRAQYRRTANPDVFAVRWTTELLELLMQTQSAPFAAQFSGVCSVLRAGGRPVAVHAGLRSRRVLHWWFPAYDPAFARYSPGIILLQRLAEALPAAGVATIDLGKGDAAYKRALMTGAAELAEGAVARPSLLSFGATLLPNRAVRRLERAWRLR
jgi:CelD/BcsL family acetyltransferase involved in cellulose biosynthesis